MNWTEIITAPFRLVMVLAGLVLLAPLLVIAKIFHPKTDICQPLTAVKDFILHGINSDGDNDY